MKLPCKQIPLQSIHRRRLSSEKNPNGLYFEHEGRNAPKQFISSVTDEEPKTISTSRLIHPAKQTFKNLVPMMLSIRVNSSQLFGLLNLKMENFQQLQKFSTRVEERDQTLLLPPPFFDEYTGQTRTPMPSIWFFKFLDLNKDKLQGGKTSSKQKNGIARHSEV